mmetsp:Transcript_56218/g.150134  ORF Transcript_56218/g.150134 Transcript_56218/m.150134 type:complete len:221 (+) Transcript_56218:602-1264(+)
MCGLHWHSRASPSHEFELLVVSRNLSGRQFSSNGGHGKVSKMTDVLIQRDTHVSPYQIEVVGIHMQRIHVGRRSLDVLQLFQGPQRPRFSTVLLENHLELLGLDVRRWQELPNEVCQGHVIQLQLPVNTAQTLRKSDDWVYHEPLLPDADERRNEPLRHLIELLRYTILRENGHIGQTSHVRTVQAQRQPQIETQDTETLVFVPDHAQEQARMCASLPRF